jgi:hypothetical protein
VETSRPRGWRLGNRTPSASRASFGADRGLILLEPHDAHQEHPTEYAWARMSEIVVLKDRCGNQPESLMAGPPLAG